LEYCCRDQAVLREQYYLDLLQPEYMAALFLKKGRPLKKAGSRLGSKHSLEANRIRAEEHKVKHIEHLKRLNSSPEQK